MDREAAVKILVTHRFSEIDAAERADIVLNCWPPDEDSPLLEGLDPALRMELAESEFPPDDVSGPMFDRMVFEALHSEFYGVTNEFLQSELSKSGITEPVEGTVEKLFPCPCCCYLTLGEVAEYDICPVCFWEDDGNRCLDCYSGPNHQTLREGRTNFATLRAKSPRAKSHVLPDGKERYLFNRSGIVDKYSVQPCRKHLDQTQGA